MAAKGYSAGAIFLQVVPVFKDVQKAISDEAKNIDRVLGDEMERSGSKAGERAGKAASKSMSTEMGKGGEEAGSAFEVAFKRSINKALRELNESTRKEVVKIKAELYDLGTAKINVDISEGMARQKLRAIADEADKLSRKRIGLSVDAKVAGAVAALDEVDHVQRRLNGQKVTIRTEVNGTARAIAALEALKKKTNDAQAAANDGGNSFRIFNGILLAAVSAGPALIPVLGAIAGGLAALGPAAAVGGAGIGAAIIGFSGLKDALTALGNQQDQATTTAQSSAKAQRAATKAIETAQNSLADAHRNAARAAEDSARAVANAERSAARAAKDAAAQVASARQQAAASIASALQRQQDAQRSYQQSVKDVADAEQALRDARAAAADDGKKLQTQIAENQLAIRQGLIDSFNATVANNAVQSDGSSTNLDKEQAAINRQQALLHLTELRQQGKDLAAQQAKWDKSGVNGTSAVQSAQDQLNNALAQQKQNYQALQQAAKAVDDARTKGAQQVSKAIMDQNRVLADNKRSIEDAQRAQQRSAADGVRSIKQAQQQVALARQGYVDTFSAINSQQQAVNAAFAKLGPAGRKFALFLFGLRKDFYGLRDDIQTVMLPAVQQAINGLMGSRTATAVHNLLVTMGAEFGNFAKALSRSFRGSAWLDFFRSLNKIGPSISRAYGNAFIKFLEGMASIMTTLAPYAVQFARGLSNIMDAFAKWAKSKSGVKGIQGFMDYARSQGPAALTFLGRFVIAVGDIAVALAPWGGTVLKILNSFLGFIDRMNPRVLQLIAGAILAAFLSAQLFSTANVIRMGILGIIDGFTSMGLTALRVAGFFIAAAGTMSATSAIMMAAILPIIAIVALFGLGLVLLYKHNTTFRNAVNAVWHAIADVFKWVWNKAIKPVLGWIGDLLSATFKGMKWAWENILWPVIKLIAKVYWNIWKDTFKVIFVLILAAWKGLMLGMKWAWDHILHPVWNAIKDAASWLWQHALKPVFDVIGRGFKNLFDGMKWAWEHTLGPVFDHIGKVALPKLQSAFKTVVGAIGNIWGGLQDLIKAPIKFVLDTVVNKGLIKGFNSIAHWVGQDSMKIPYIHNKALGFASGGIMPGYTPGRDVHRFISPTAGQLELSGGEAIMRPEWTAAMGPAYVNHMNRIAREKGASGIRKAMGFATGGIARFSQGGINGGGVSSPDEKVYLNGMAISRVAAAQVALARKLSGIPIYMMQGGFGGNHIAASGSSHNYPGVGDFGPGSISLEKIMRQVGFAAWARNVAGRSQVGSGAHVHAVSLLDPGDRTSPQVYGSWANHGNGLSGANNDPAPHYSWIPGLMGKIAGMGIGEITSLVGGKGGGGGWGLPHWVSSVAKNPLGWIKGLVSKPIDAMKEKFGDSKFLKEIVSVPMSIAKNIAHKAIGMIPGGKQIAEAAGALKDVAGDIGHGIGSAASGAGHLASDAWHSLGLANGGILPYNGTMKYDNGGYLPPGLTSVLNLTGQPEPVFTADQFSGMSGDGAGTIHYEPHFEGSNLTAEDVAADMNFTFRRIKRGGKYQAVGV